MKYKNLRKLNDYVQANDWSISTDTEYNNVSIFELKKDYQVEIADVDGFLEVRTNYIGFEMLAENQKRTLFELLLEVALLSDKERFEVCE